MMGPISLKIAVPNGLLFVRDSKASDIPDTDFGDGASVYSIPTCIMVVCLVDSEGETDITVGEASQIEPSNKLLFEGALETPSRKLVLEIVPGETVLEVDVPSATNRIRIWTDGRHRCAETVVIGFGDMK
jgi:hypothetical protein